MVSEELPVLCAEEVIQRYGDMVLRAAFGFVKNQHDAEDIAQEVFLSLVRTAPQFDSAEHQKAWLLRCTINRCKSHFRSAWHRHTAPLEETLSSPFTPEENIVLDAVNALPLKYQQVVYLHYIEGYSTAEIGQILDRNSNTVLSQLSRGRTLLKNALKGDF